VDLVDEFGRKLMTAHRHWAIKITANNGDQFTAIGELEMRGSVGGADQTDPVTAQTAASATSEFSAAFADEHAFDDSTTGSNGWWTTSAAPFPHRLAYDFTSPINIVQIAVSAPNGSTGITAAPQDFEIQYSDLASPDVNDDADWTTERSYSGETAWSLGEQRLYFAAPADSGILSIPLRQSVARGS
jgi:hypothetical protein